MAKPRLLHVPTKPINRLASSQPVHTITPAERGANYYFLTLPEMDK